MCATLFLSMFTRGRGVMISALVVALVWLVWSAFILASDDYNPWYLGIITDMAAALYLVKQPSNRPKALLAGTFCIMVLMNIACGFIIITGGTVDGTVHEPMLDATGWAQLVLIAGWACGNIGGHFVRRWGLGASGYRKTNYNHMDRGK